MESLVNLYFICVALRLTCTPLCGILVQCRLSWPMAYAHGELRVASVNFYRLELA